MAWQRPPHPLAYPARSLSSAPSSRAFFSDQPRENCGTARIFACSEKRSASRPVSDHHGRLNGFDKKPKDSRIATVFAATASHIHSITRRVGLTAPLLSSLNESTSDVAVRGGMLHAHRS